MLTERLVGFPSLAQAPALKSSAHQAVTGLMASLPHSHLTPDAQQHYQGCEKSGDPCLANKEEDVEWSFRLPPANLPTFCLE